MDLSGKAALISGAGGGICRAIAVAFAEAGASVSICARGADALEAARREIAAHGVTGHGFAGHDVTGHDVTGFCAAVTDRAGPDGNRFTKSGGMTCGVAEP